jgi:thiamine-phosphate pyrophosphorylase
MLFLRPNLTLVVDRLLYRPQVDREPLSLVDEAIHGGATMVQLRLAKDADPADLGIWAVAQRLREITEGRVPLVITGDLELAERCHADGVLLVEEISYRPADARKFIRPPTKLVGCYANSVAVAARAERGQADYVQVGPIFGSDGNGVALLRKIKDSIHLPVIAFGGISSAELAREAMQAGADGVAVTHGILSAPNPRLAAQSIMAAISNFSDAPS